MVAVSSWGRLNNSDHEVKYLSCRESITSEIKSKDISIPHGMGRSYGDVCLNPKGILWNTTGLNRFIHFNKSSGTLTCESGVLLRDIQKLAVKNGWLLPVTPGTQLITVGGAIANDIHGKNHHIFGSFGNHINKITILRTNGELIECSRTINNKWFSATVGGIGLTGLILTAEIQLRKISGPWLDAETIPYSNLSEFFDLASTSEASWEHTVSWIDCISSKGRGIFMRANHINHVQSSDLKSTKIKIPLVPPISLVNKLTLKPFNYAYYNIKKWSAGSSKVHYEPFFYPLDNLQEWNRMYGPRGFYQYQSVVPLKYGHDAIQAMLTEITRNGDGSFLAVLKTFGDIESLGMLSFAQKGVTLALDFPNKGFATQKLFDRLDKIVIEAGGRIYLAKDARMPISMFEAGYPKLNEFLAYRDPNISSAMSRRLMGS